MPGVFGSQLVSSVDLLGRLVLDLGWIGSYSGYTGQVVLGRGCSDGKPH
jgi:hypothetical protein